MRYYLRDGDIVGRGPQPRVPVIMELIMVFFRTSAQVKDLRLRVAELERKLAEANVKIFHLQEDLKAFRKDIEKLRKS